MDTYEKAKELKLSLDFLSLLEEALIRRGIICSKINEKTLTKNKKHFKEKNIRGSRK